MERILFKKIYIETVLKDHPIALEIINKLPSSSSKNIYYIENYEDVFGKVKKPYLEKRTNLNLFLAQKKGTLVKEAPAAYGLGKEKHFYFINSYNCIYECEYCYLQGFFNSPDIVAFINWEEIKNEIIKVANENHGCWFHAGEFSDSLAISNITGELSRFFDLFKEIPDAKLELRTKSINIREALHLKPAQNIIFSFSLSTENACKTIDLKTPTLRHRIKAIRNLQNKGHQIGLHLDPIVWTPNWSAEHEELISFISQELDLKKISYISLGVVRFTDEVYYQFQKNYPQSQIHLGEFKRSFDNKVRYPKALRHKMLSFVREQLVFSGVDSSIIYDCME